MKQRELVKWLKRILALSALAGLVLCGLIAPKLGDDAVLMNPELQYMFWPCLAFIWITAIPLYIALWKAWQICCDIAKDNSFCKQNGKRLKDISKLALSEGILYFTAAMVLLLLNLLQVGILLMNLFIIFVAVSIAVASATLSHLVDKASTLKQENDLTI